MYVYYTKKDYKRTVATLYDDNNERQFELLIFPLSFYTNRRDDIEDTNVPYTIEMYQKSDLCSRLLTLQTNEAVNHFIDVVNKFIVDIPFKSLFFSADSDLYQYYWSTVRPDLSSLMTTHTSIFNHEQTLERVRHWPNFLNRFNKRKMTLMMRNEYESMYASQWWDLTKTIKE